MDEAKPSHSYPRPWLWLRGQAPNGQRLGCPRGRERAPYQKVVLCFKTGQPAWHRPLGPERDTGLQARKGPLKVTHSWHNEASASDALQEVSRQENEAQRGTGAAPYQLRGSHLFTLFTSLQGHLSLAELP